MLTKNTLKGEVRPLETIDPAEVAKFTAMADDWWNPRGKFRPLHKMNPVRLDFVLGQLCAQFGRNPRAEQPLAGLALCDVGCGGGLLAEPLARLGARVTGIDASAANIPVAQIHAAQSGLSIDYRHTTAEALGQAGARFDAVISLEVIEHVADPAGFVRACADLLRPGGLFICSTLNRTAKSFALAIVGAEYVLRWLPVGTHDWKKFIKPDEMRQMMTDAGLRPVLFNGFVFDPLRDRWSISESDLAVNFAAAATRPE